MDLLKEDELMTVVLDSLPRTLAERIEGAVRERTGGRIRGLRVEIEEGQIVISGRVSTYYTKQLVTHAVLESTGDFFVVNDVSVG